MGHPAVKEAAVVGVPDEKWDERPLACVVLKDGENASVDDLKGFLADRVAKWWLPERWAFIEEVPKTSVGKFDKKCCGPATPRASWKSRKLGFSVLPKTGF